MNKKNILKILALTAFGLFTLNGANAACPFFNTQDLNFSATTPFYNVDDANSYFPMHQ